VPATAARVNPTATPQAGHSFRRGGSRELMADRYFWIHSSSWFLRYSAAWIVVWSLHKCSPVIERNRNGCCVYVTGSNISAVPITGPAAVTNNTFIGQPCRSGAGKPSRPPVRDTTCNVAVVQAPSWRRRTAGVCSARLRRGERQGTCSWGRSAICQAEYGTCYQRLGDYQSCWPANTVPPGVPHGTPRFRDLQDM
jgi:hypothetical protein